MDSQVDKETLNKLLENDMVSLSGGELGINLLGPHLHAHYQEDAHHKTFLNTGLITGQTTNPQHHKHC